MSVLRNFFIHLIYKYFSTHGCQNQHFPINGKVGARPLYTTMLIEYYVFRNGGVGTNRTHKESNNERIFTHEVANTR
jgi:hypothetical protein